MAEVLISYSRRDKEFAFKLRDKLVEHKREVWIDSKDIPATAEWQQEISTNIEAADNFLFVISPESVASANCKKEIDHAVANNKRMVPIFHRPVPDEDIPATLGKFQRIDFDHDDRFDENFAALIKTLDTDLDWTRTHTRLLTRAKEWERKTRDSSFLLRGKDLSEAEQWAATSAEKEPKPTTLHSQYILAGRQAATRLQRIIIGAVAFALVIAVGLAIYAFKQKNVAQLEARIANARRLATESLSRFALTPSALAVSGALGLESFKAYATPEGMQALSRVLRLIPAAPEIIHDAHQKMVGSLAFSRDGRWMASGGEQDGKIILWDLSNQRKKYVLEVPHPFRPPALALAFDSSGRWLGAGLNGAVCIWETQSGKLVQEPIRHSYVVLSLAFSPNGLHLATSTMGSSKGHGIRLFKRNSEQWKEVKPFPSGKGELIGVGFPKDDVLAVADASGVWFRSLSPSATDNSLKSFTELGACFALTLSADSSKLAALCANGIVSTEVGDVSELSCSKTESLHEHTSTSISLNADGEFIAIRGLVYQLRDGTESSFLATLDSSVRPVAFQPDGKVLAGGLDDGSIALWSTGRGMESIRLPIKNEETTALAFAPNSQLAAAGATGNLRIFDISDPARIKLVKALPVGSGLSRPKFSPDGRFFVVFSESTVHLFQTETWNELVHYELSGENASAAFSKDNQTLFTVDAVGIRRFDTSTGQEKQPTISCKCTVFAISPDGAYLKYPGTIHWRRPLENHDDASLGAKYGLGGRVVRRRT